MSNFDRNPEWSGYENDPQRVGWSKSPASWIVIAVAVAIVVLTFGYIFQGTGSNSPGVTEHRAVATDTPLSTRTLSPAPAPTTQPAAPEASPKP
jgi:hypothetical protein